jgi:hypothetical protein
VSRTTLAKKSRQFEPVESYAGIPFSVTTLGTIFGATIAVHFEIRAVAAIFVVLIYMSISLS